MAGIPRSIAPLVSMDFGAGCFAQCNNPVLFEDLFTYSRNSSATFINRRIVCGKAEYFLDTDFVGDVENLALFSEQFNNAVWTKDSVTVLADNDEDENGIKIADRIHPASTGTNRGVNQDITATTADHDVSFKIKAAGFDWVKIFDAAGVNGAWFNVKQGIIGTISGTPAAKIEPLENDYFRCSIADAGAVSGTAKMILSDTDNSTTATLNGTDGVLIIGAQLTLGSKTLPYVKTITIAVTEAFTETLRIEYNAVTGENLGALIEGVSTNLTLRSEEFDDGAWSKTASTVSPNVSKAVDGTTSVDKFIPNNSAALSASYVRQNFTQTASAKTYTQSIFCKRAEFDQITLTAHGNTTSDFSTIVVNLDTGAITPSDGGGYTNISSSVVKIGDMFRIKNTFTTNTDTQVATRIFAKDSVESLGDGSSGILIWGAQLEELSFASSYIRTEGSSVARAADDLSLPSAGNFKADEYTIHIKAFCSSLLSQLFYGINDGTDNNRIGAESSNGTSRSFQKSNGQTDVLITSGQLSEVEFNDFVVTLGSNGDFNHFLNTSLEGSATGVGTMVGISTILFGRSFAGTGRLYGHISKFSIYDVDLTAQEVSLL